MNTHGDNVYPKRYPVADNETVFFYNFAIIFRDEIRCTITSHGHFV